jgi:hypothetical protein
LSEKAKRYTYGKLTRKLSVKLQGNYAFIIPAAGPAITIQQNDDFKEREEKKWEVFLFGILLISFSNSDFKIQAKLFLN